MAMKDSTIPRDRELEPNHQIQDEFHQDVPTVQNPLTLINHFYQSSLLAYSLDGIKCPHRAEGKFLEEYVSVDLSRGGPKAPLSIATTEVLGRALLFSLDCSTIPLIITL